MAEQHQVQFIDSRAEHFVRVPATFFALQPSTYGIAAYNAIAYFASWTRRKNEGTSIPRMAALVHMSVRAFHNAVAELVKKKAVRVHHRTQKTANGKREKLTNVYELLEIKGPKADDF